MKIKISNLLIPVVTVLAVTSCQMNKEAAMEKMADCSMAFNTFPNATFTNKNTQFVSTECKVLPLQINENTKCEISGSNKIDNLINFYEQNPGDKVFFKTPLEVIENDISFKDKVDIYLNIKKVKDHVDSDLFDSLKDYRYKGISCVSDTHKFVSWIDDKDVVVVYEKGSKSVKSVSKKSAKSQNKTN